MVIFILFHWGLSLVGRTYRFSETDPTLIEILDELVRDRQLTPTIHNLLINGLGKDIKKTKKDLKKRIDNIDRVGRLYKKLSTQEKDKKEEAYKSYIDYRQGFEKNEIPYDHTHGLGWIEKKAKSLGKNKEKLLIEFEERYGREKK